MSKLLNGIQGVINYQDDILIHSPDVESHDKILDCVLSKLKCAGIKLNIKKCEFYVNCIEYLGHIFDQNGVHPNPNKVRAIVDAPAPQDLKQLQAFIGICQYYRRFIRDFATTFSPLYSLLKKNVKFVWEESQQKCFNLIKNLFKNHNVLKIFDSKKETMLETDSSSYGTAAVLMQRDNASEPWRPVEFASKSLNSHEKNYSNLEREALSVIFGVTKFRKYLLGSPFIIHNDQQPLRKLLAHDSSIPLNCSARVQRWALKLSQYNYRFVYSKGTDNVNSDCLSRLPLKETEPSCEPYEIIFAVKSLNSLPITCKDVSNHINNDKDLSMLRHFIKYGFPHRLNNPKLLHFKDKIHELSLFDDCIMYRNRIFIPESLRKLVLDQIHEGHPGICGMKSIARSLIWYPNIDNEIESYVKSCENCQMNASKPPQKCNVQWPLPKRPWSRVHLDHFFYENHVCLIAVDALSRYVEVEIVKDTSAGETIDALRLIFSRNGLCDDIVSDNATSFTAQSFQDFLSINGINHVTSPAYSPSSNGQAERGVRLVKELLKKTTCGSFKTRLARVLMHYRSVPHSVTKIAPFVALNNRRLITSKDRINPHFCVSNKKENCKSFRKFNVGDRVLALNLREGPKWLHATIVQQLGINVYGVHVHDLNVVWKRHANQMLNDSITIDDNNSQEIYFDAQSYPLPQQNYPVLPEINCSPSEISNSQSVEKSKDSELSNNVDVSVSRDDPDSVSPTPTLRRSERIRKPVERYGI